MPSNVKVSSSWKTVSAMYTRVGGSWKNVTEGYTRIGGAWKSFFTSNALVVDHLVIAGGGSGGGYFAGGGGGGGYRTSVGTSGGGASAESRVTVAVSTNYTVTVGAGGSTGSGSNSVFGTITSTGGGRGGTGGGSSTLRLALTGGSGGGGGSTTNGGNSLAGAAGTANQGYAGGNSPGMAGNYPGAGGGGAGSVGVSPATVVSAGGNGGSGVASSITGTSVTRAGGGGGGAGDIAAGTGTAGGGNGSVHSLTTGNVTTNGSAGTANTGGGGGGGGQIGVSPDSQWAGGSGVVILKYPSTFTINTSPGLSHRTVTSAGFNITTFTAGTGTVSFSEAVDSDYELIETVYLTSSQSSVTFDVSGLGSEYQHLQIRTSLRSNNGAVWEETKLTFNGSSSGYRSHLLGGTGSSVFSTWSDTTSTYIRPWAFAVGANATANVFGAAVIDILDPFETTKNKTVRTLGGRVPANGETRIALSSGLWENTAAVTSITIAPEAGSQWVANSRFSLYGIKGA